MSLRITVLVENRGRDAGSSAIEVVVDGQVVASETIYLDPDERREIELVADIDLPTGHYELDVVTDHDTSTGVVEVLDPPANASQDDREVDDDTPTEDPIPGFTTASAVAATVGVSLVAARRYLLSE